MKTCSFFVTFFLAMVMVSAFSTEEHVKRFFRPEHKAYLPETTSLTLEDESALANVPQNDDSTKCLSVCEPKCDKLDVPDYLTVNITLYHILFVGFWNKWPVFFYLFYDFALPHSLLNSTASTKLLGYQKRQNWVVSRSIPSLILLFSWQRNASFHRFEDEPINCVLASTVVFKKNPQYRCKWLGLYLFDCCRACNAKHAKCLKELRLFHGGPEFCYRRDNYKCMCKCLAKHNPLENHYRIGQ